MRDGSIMEFGNGVIDINHSNEDKPSLNIFDLAIEDLDIHLSKQGFYLPEKLIEDYEKDIESVYRLYDERYMTIHEYARIIHEIINRIQSDSRKIESVEEVLE